jgi:hypothetical protein
MSTSSSEYSRGDAPDRSRPDVETVDPLMHSRMAPPPPLDPTVGHYERSARDPTKSIEHYYEKAEKYKHKSHNLLVDLTQTRRELTALKLHEINARYARDHEDELILDARIQAQFDDEARDPAVERILVMLPPPWRVYSKVRASLVLPLLHERAAAMKLTQEHQKDQDELHQLRTQMSEIGVNVNAYYQQIEGEKAEAAATIAHSQAENLTLRKEIEALQTQVQQLSGSRLKSGNASERSQPPGRERKPVLVLSRHRMHACAGQPSPSSPPASVHTSPPHSGSVTSPPSYAYPMPPPVPVLRHEHSASTSASVESAHVHISSPSAYSHAASSSSSSIPPSPRSFSSVPSSLVPSTASVAPSVACAAWLVNLNDMQAKSNATSNARSQTDADGGTMTEVGTKKRKVDHVRTSSDEHQGGNNRMEN